MVGGDAPLLDKFKMLKELGYDGIDMDRPAERAEVLRARDESGLVIHGVVDYVHWGQPLTSPDPKVREQGLQGLEGCLRDAKAYGGATGVAVGGVWEKKIFFARGWQRLQARNRKGRPLGPK